MIDRCVNSIVLVASEDAEITKVLRLALLAEGHEVRVVHDRAGVVDHTRSANPDLLLLSVAIAGADHFELCRQLRFDAHTRFVPIMLISNTVDRESRVQGLRAGADDVLTMPVDQTELSARVRSLVRLKRQTDEMDSAAAIITTLAVMIETRDGYSEGHCHRMANYATALGRALSLPESDIQALHRGGFLHDIGMLAISDSVLRINGPLTPAQYELIQSHTVIGDELCSNLRSLQAIRPIVRSHHERLDGSGYPDRLNGNQVPLLAQIIGIVDAFDGITSRRAYHEEQSATEAIAVLRQQAARGWRRDDLVEVFADLVDAGRLGAFSGRAV